MAQRRGTWARKEQEATSSSLLQYLNILRRRIWVILPVVLISTTLGVLKAFRSPKLYRAAARVLVERYAPSVMRFEEGLTDRSGWDPDFYTTQAQLVRSRAVLELALRDLRLQEWFSPQTPAAEMLPRASWWSELKSTLLAVLGGRPATPPEPWEMLRARIGTAQIPETHFLEIRGVDARPDRAALLANVTAEAFQEYHRQRKVDLLGEAFEMLQKEKDKQEAELRKAEEELQTFRQTARSVALDRDKGDPPALDRLVKLNDQLTAVQIRRIRLGSELAVIREATENRSGMRRASEERLFAIPAVQSDASLSATRRNLAEAEKEAAALAEVYGVEHPQLVAARTRVTVLRDQFQKQLQEVLEAEQMRLKALEAEEAELQTQYEEQRRTAVDLAREEFTFTRLQNAVDRHRRLLDAIVERMREVDVSSGLVKTNVQIVERASPPTIPIGAGKRRIVLLAVLMGLCVGGALALVVENVDDTIKTPEDLRERVDFPLLGFVPSMEADPPDAFPKKRQTTRRGSRMRRWVGEWIPFVEEPVVPDAEAGRAHRGRMLLTEPLSSMAEAYRNIRASLFYSSPAEEVKVLGVTSCRPQEGKTTTLTNLALAIAQTGKRVLALDADLHRPALARTLGIEASRGLTSVLVGEVSLEEATARLTWEGTEVEHLDVVAAGPPSPNPSELISSQRMKDLLARVKTIYDWVLVDTPPVLFVSDARTLSVLCDGVVLVVKAGSGSRSLLDRAREQLETVHARVVGVILNEVRVTRVGRHYSTYASYGYARYARDYHHAYYGRSAEADRMTRPSAPPEKASDSVAAPERAPQRAPLSPVDQARLHQEAGNPGRARLLLEKHTEEHPEDLQAWELLIAIAVQEKDDAGLETTLSRYRGARGEHGYVYALGQGYRHWLKKDFARALECFEEAATLRPDHPGVLEALLRAMLPQHDPTALRERAQQLLRLRPDQPFGHYILGRVALLAGDRKGAEHAFRRSLKAGRILETLNDLAWLLQEDGHLEEAEILAREAVERDSRCDVAWDALGVVLTKAGRLTEAEAALDRAWRLSNGFSPYGLRLAELQRRLGRRDRVETILREVRSQRPTLLARDQAALADLERWLHSEGDR